MYDIAVNLVNKLKDPNLTEEELEQTIIAGDYLAQLKPYIDVHEALSEVNSYYNKKYVFSGQELHLVKCGEGAYEFQYNARRDCDKVLKYEAESGNYYDKETNCWLWLNTYVKPVVWQYWYKAISSDFGDYGWMEWDDSGKKWYIESSSGKWIEVPTKYDISNLWHLSLN